LFGYHSLGPALVVCYCLLTRFLPHTHERTHIQVHSHTRHEHMRTLHREQRLSPKTITCFGFTGPEALQSVLRIRMSSSAVALHADHHNV
jgi:hypothetical protein